MTINLLVIRTENPEALKEQYEALGFTFEYHKHGNGPYHFASEQDSFVFEIYPLSIKTDNTEAPIRLGFDIENLVSKIKELQNSTWKIVSEPKVTPWGEIAIIKDLDGRKIELKNK